MQPLSEDERSHVADVVRRVEVDEELDFIRIKYACDISLTSCVWLDYAFRDLYKEHNMLCSNHIEDDKTQLCSKCGNKPRSAVICSVCQKV